MVQARRHARLAFGALRMRVVGGCAVPRNDLHGHLAFELLVEGEPDDAEAAGAYTSLEAVTAEHELPRRVALVAVGSHRQSGGGVVERVPAGRRVVLRDRRRTVGRAETGAAVAPRRRPLV